MAKIIQLPTAGPLLPEDYTVVFQGGRTKKVSVAALGGGGNGGSVSWFSIPGKPNIVASGATVEEARNSIAAASASSLDSKVDKVAGKGLSTEDFTTDEKTKLAGIAEGANNYTHPSFHPASIIVQDASRRFVSDTEKNNWNNKLEDAPSDGKTYGRKDGVWVEGGIVEGGIVEGGIAEVPQPSNVSPANAAANVGETPTLAGSAYYSLYSAAQQALQVQVSTDPTFATTVYDSGSLPPGISHTLPAGKLAVSTAYHWRLRYQNARGTWSEWSAATSFTTASQFNSYIPTPTATPANFGDAFEGGFYAGMIWGELVQSATSTTLGTGSKTFTVPDMTDAPIVHEGQQLEIRSRANPANKMIGTVTGASGTQLTINVTSVGGSGTFSDWSIMSRYRVIVAPKASGEHAGVQLKNANTALPEACRTLNEGMRATQAMRDADSSAVYPAAHWARSLNIGGRTDWYIPARDELELLWRNLKPVTNNNYATADRPTGASHDYKINGAYGDTANTHGLNNNSAPPGAAYTGSGPGQTTAAAFKSGGAEVFEFGAARYWSSSEYSASNAWHQLWHSSYPGYQSSNHNKTSAFMARAVRRSVI